MPVCCGRTPCSLWWGTAVATRVPPVGWTPFKSLEQLMALLVFIFMWGIALLRDITGAALMSRFAPQGTADPCTGIYDHLRSACAGCSAAGTQGSFRPPLLPRPCFVCAAHPHRQPSRRFRRGTHAHVSGCILVLFPHMPAGIVARVFCHPLFMLCAVTTTGSRSFCCITWVAYYFSTKMSRLDAAFRARWRVV
ncbi:putative oligosaccharyl transferase subunit [Trypanosoma cruzi]|uniref:Putative oligosaccharyl transferase subunit n=1 Tax=Trypanosoma cruzi TaxID=5693 RepID=A0A2V2WSM4_TRYCR|nr:putative oligosaccharyl transferase subunit [Trypanosoma cruzi]